MAPMAAEVSGPPTGDPRTASTAALPTSRERLLPWLGGAAVVALVILAVVILGEGEPRPIEIASLLGGLGATIAIAGLVSVRSTREMEAAEREERARPAREQLADLESIGCGDRPGARSYVNGMERWTISLLELVEHAVDITEQDEIRDELVIARDDTDALRALLHASSERDLTLNEVATLHSVCALWETNQDRIEQLAAAADLAWHRRWRARSVVERLLRHGPPVDAGVALPYRS
jgi:hypothetical protein